MYVYFIKQTVLAKRLSGFLSSSDSGEQLFVRARYVKGTTPSK